MTLDVFCTSLIKITRSIHSGHLIDAPMANIYMICDRFSAVMGDRVVLKLRIDTESILDTATFMQRIQQSTEAMIGRLQMT